MTPQQILKVRDCRVIGLVGRAGSGKTLAAQRIIDLHFRCSRYSFALPLKRMVQTLIDHTKPRKWPYTGRDYTDDPNLKNEPIPFLMGLTARRLMQTLGTEWGREQVHPDLWIELARVKVERKLGTAWFKERPGNIGVVFDDVRFANEAAMIREMGGAIVQITRNVAGTDNPVQDAHVSEQFDVKPDITLTNNGTVMQFWNKIDMIWPSERKEVGARSPRII